MTSTNPTTIVCSSKEGGQPLDAISSGTDSWAKTREESPPESIELRLAPEVAYPTQIVAQIPALRRVARYQLRDEHAANDVVQDVIVAALSHIATFEGRSPFSAWLFAILRRKIIDYVKANGRETVFSDLVHDEDELTGDELLEHLFNEAGQWRPDVVVSHWKLPEEALESAEFIKIVEACIDLLPPRLREVFVMRDILDLDTEEICKTLQISKTNCWVSLHRARLAVRNHLELNWFQGKSED